jgi:hypothetical protein
MARTKGSIKEEFTPPKEVLLSEDERITILADIMFEIITEQVVSEDENV